MDKIAIIGAGLAGLSAARQLQLAGHEVDVYDKGHRAGGRLSSRQEAWGGYDQGAQYFTARDPRFIAQLETWRHQLKAALWAVVPKRWSDGELTESADREQRWVGLPTMHALAVDLSQQLSLYLNSRIVALSREQEQWWLYDGKGHQFGPYRGLLLAIPAPQAATLVPLACPLQARLHDIPMRPCWSIALGFNQRLSGPRLGADEAAGIFCQHPMLRWIARDSDKPARRREVDTWVLHCQAEWTRQHWQSPQAELVRLGQQALAQVLGIAVPAPHYSAVHRWRFADQLPASSSLNPGQAQTRHHASIDDGWKIAACGDWQHGGRVEGAYLSGLEAATHILHHWS